LNSQSKVVVRFLVAGSGKTESLHAYLQNFDIKKDLHKQKFNDDF